MRAEITLPTLHVDQVRAYEVIRSNRFVAVRCGRRWGKTDLGITIACDGAIKQKRVGWFTPEYKFQSESYAAMSETLEPLVESASEQKGIIRTLTKGRIDFWTLNNKRAGRSRKYHKALIDEGAFTDSDMMDMWDKNIMPTLLDYEGTAVVMSNTNGVDPKNFFYRICNEPEHGFKEFWAPTSNNPYMPAAEIERLRLTTHPMVFKQEYMAEFVDWTGVQFFALDDLLMDGLPVDVPGRVDAVFVTIDTAVKTGREHDATAVVYWAYIKFGHDYKLVVLDWDIVQIEGSLLVVWLPTVYQNLEALATTCQARRGSLGAFIEDKVSGTILLQQAARNHWPATAIDSKLTAVGKDERAISVSGYVYRRQVKISRPAFDKVVTLRGATRNHFLSQVLGFRIGVEDQEDDLLDCFTYGVAITLGDAKGY